MPEIVTLLAKVNSRDRRNPDGTDVDGQDDIVAAVRGIRAVFKQHKSALLAARGSRPELANGQRALCEQAAQAFC